MLTLTPEQLAAMLPPAARERLAELAHLAPEVESFNAETGAACVYLHVPGITPPGYRPGIHVHGVELWTLTATGRMAGPYPACGGGPIGGPVVTCPACGRDSADGSTCCDTSDMMPPDGVDCPDCGGAGIKVGPSGYEPCTRWLSCWADVDADPSGLR